MQNHSNQHIKFQRLSEDTKQSSLKQQTLNHHQTKTPIARLINQPKEKKIKPGL